MNIDELLESYKRGDIDIAVVKQQLEKLPYEDLDFAKLDHHRRLRNGHGEVVYCDGKVTEHLVSIFQKFAEEDSEVLGSRATYEQYEAVQKVLPEVTYDSVSRILKLQRTKKTIASFDAQRQTEKIESNDSTGIGNICVCTGGTADIPVAEEAAQTAEFFGNNVTRLYDVGVAGIHRLLSNLDVIRQANCIIAVAGMEGALPGVIAGLVQTPVIGVPTSIGYGTGYQGASAVLTMLNSCSNGIATVNIDNGFGAAYIASQINHQTVEGKSSGRTK